MKAQLGRAPVGKLLVSKFHSSQLLYFHQGGYTWPHDVGAELRPPRCSCSVAETRRCEVAQVLAAKLSTRCILSSFPSLCMHICDVFSIFELAEVKNCHHSRSFYSNVLAFTFTNTNPTECDNRLTASWTRTYNLSFFFFSFYIGNITDPRVFTGGQPPFRLLKIPVCSFQTLKRFGSSVEFQSQGSR
jgi:hypothetical protein